MKNPAVHLYQLWREIVRWHAETRVDWYRAASQDWIDKATQGKDIWSRIHEDGEVEKTSLNMYNGHEKSHAPLDYRMGLRVVGITDRHVFDTPTLGPDMSVFEPIIRLQANIGGWNRPGNIASLIDLYPNGDFRLYGLPSTFYQIYPRWTFLKTSWVAGKRQWVVPPVGGSPLLDAARTWERGWVFWDTKNWNHPISYLPNHSFTSGARYMLEPDIHGFWRVTTQRNSPVGEYDFNLDGDSAKLLRDGYARSQKRYRRFERASESNKEQRKRDKIALYVPEHGRVTGQEAIERFTHNMRVYEPVQATKEAAGNGSNSMGTSPVHQ